MRYVKNIDLWNPETQARVLSGELKLQAGQWVKCGGERPSRFVRCTGRSIWVAHWQGSSAATEARFRMMLNPSK